MMGLPEGHICSVPAPPGMTDAGLRNAQLKAGGNGVVPQQAAYALGLLAVRAAESGVELFRPFSSRNRLLVGGAR